MDKNHLAEKLIFAQLSLKWEKFLLGCIPQSRRIVSKANHITFVYVNFL
jgi:hypothetical protein